MSIVVAKVVEVTELVTIAVVVVTAVAVAVMVVLGMLLVPSRQRHVAETRELEVSSRSILLTTLFMMGDAQGGNTTALSKRTVLTIRSKCLFLTARATSIPPGGAGGTVTVTVAALFINQLRI